MGSLDEILTSTRARVQRAKEDFPLRDPTIEVDVPAPRDLRAALVCDGVALIAEIKRATPSYFRS